MRLQRKLHNRKHFEVNPHLCQFQPNQNRHDKNEGRLCPPTVDFSMEVLRKSAMYWTNKDPISLVTK
jgi:hypothetical protein